MIIVILVLIIIGLLLYNSANKQEINQIKSKQFMVNPDNDKFKLEKMIEGYYLDSIDKAIISHKENTSMFSDEIDDVNFTITLAIKRTHQDLKLSLRKDRITELFPEIEILLIIDKLRDKYIEQYKYY